MLKSIPILLLAMSAALVNAYAQNSQPGGIQSPQNSQILAPFDIILSKITTKDNIATFHMSVTKKAGKNKPTPSGKLAGSRVFSYVWPTSLDTALVGFESKQGILSLAVTSHPDFDDTPLYDENGDKQTDNDGGIWHSHWVVLTPNDQCGKDALAVVDIPNGTKPKLPKTWPGLPILIDSPGWDPIFDANSVEIKVPFDDIGIVKKATFDGVTAGLRINQNVHAPLLCVVNVMDIASGDLSLPGKVDQ